MPPNIKVSAQSFAQYRSRRARNCNHVPAGLVFPQVDCTTASLQETITACQPACGCITLQAAAVLPVAGTTIQLLKWAVHKRTRSHQLARAFYKDVADELAAKGKAHTPPEQFRSKLVPPSPPRVFHRAEQVGEEREQTVSNAFVRPRICVVHLNLRTPSRQCDEAERNTNFSDYQTNSSTYSLSSPILIASSCASWATKTGTGALNMHLGSRTQLSLSPAAVGLTDSRRRCMAGCEHVSRQDNTYSTSMSAYLTNLQQRDGDDGWQHCISSAVVVQDRRLARLHSRFLKHACMVVAEEPSS